MADNIQPIFFCKHCEVFGHEVVHCHRLFEDLTSFAKTVGVETGYPTQGSISSRVAHWGKKKEASNSASSTATFGVPGQANGTSSTDATNLNSLEAQMLAICLEQHRMHWLWCHNLWASVLMYQDPWQPQEDANANGSHEER
ncbi:uncharacterized protein N7479_004633 [Penicillium vulpinum]|uniref:Uncharacterized protein n=1 Tax=Penicillium vulpinum TaxID=29845 RepID=A0A1V6RMW1_9EURO|nr:uncharacterized protein N7479_004633 [Penicillium vulpinum]KAJ5964757.1 hypothetical protein N7479_004633 [Penicillium vulpinum]OQE02773.1 hypothetical protein PENVUL_c038G06362 [Penicillium vulpinum]